MKRFSIDAHREAHRLNRVGSAANRRRTSVDTSGKWVIVSNYGDGPGAEGTSVAVYATVQTASCFGSQDARRLAAKAEGAGAMRRQRPVIPVSHPHAVLSPDNKFLVPDPRRSSAIISMPLPAR